VGCLLLVLGFFVVAGWLLLLPLRLLDEVDVTLEFKVVDGVALPLDVVLVVVGGWINTLVVDEKEDFFCGLHVFFVFVDFCDVALVADDTGGGCRGCCRFTPLVVS